MRSMIMLVAALAVCGSANAQPTSGELTTPDLIATAKARLAFKKPDTFAPDMSDHALAGQVFRVRMPFSEFGSQVPTWKYDAANTRLTLDYEQNATDAVILGQLNVWGLKLESHAILAGHDIKENAFGVRVRVSEYTSSTFVLGGLGDAPTTGLQPGLSTNINVSGDAARAIAVSGYAIFVGRLVDIPGSTGVTACGLSGQDATINEPVESTGDVCVVGGVIEKIEFHSADGALLDAWPHAN